MNGTTLSLDKESAVSILMAGLVLLTLIAPATAEEIEVYLGKECLNSSIRKGDIITIRDVIRNNDDKTYNCWITDIFPQPFFEPLNKDIFEKLMVDEEEPLLNGWLFQDNFTVGPYEEKIFDFEFRYLYGGEPPKTGYDAFILTIPEHNYIRTSNELLLDFRTTTTVTTVIATTLPTTIPAAVTTTPTTTMEPEREEDLSGYLPYILGIILLLAIILLYRSRRTARMKRQKEELRDWVEKQLKDGEDPKLLKRAIEKQGSDPAVVDEIVKRL